MEQTITARQLLTHSDVFDFPVITVNTRGVITGISSDPTHLRSETSTLAAAFFDIHIHGSESVDVMSASSLEMSRLQRFLAQHGVAHYLPTTVTASLDFTFRALEKLASVIEGDHASDQARPVGIHIEGPFLSHTKRGMHPAADLQAPSIEVFDRLQQAARGHIALMTIAPEPHAIEVSRTTGDARTSALELIRYASQRGVRCSLGHSNATSSETLAAIASGATSATHTFNAMRAFDHREIGILGTVLDDERLFADLICDGIHVSPAAVRLWWKAKGPERAILITDALAAAGMTHGDFKLGTTELAIRGERALVAEDLAHGKETLAGSMLTMDHAVRNLREYTSASLSAAVRAASHNASAMLGRREMTQITAGSPANLTRFDERGNLIATYLQGKEVARK